MVYNKERTATRWARDDGEDNAEEGIGRERRGKAKERKEGRGGKEGERWRKRKRERNEGGIIIPYRTPRY